MNSQFSKNDIHLLRPQAGQTLVLTISNPETRLFLGFEPGSASMGKEGQALIFRFDDGSSIRIEGFYETFNTENLPFFVLGDAEIDAATFFAADESLMPAAGPVAAQSGGRYTDFTSNQLIGGTEALDGIEGAQNTVYQAVGTLFTSTQNDIVTAIDPAGSLVESNRPTAPGTSETPPAGGGQQPPVLGEKPETPENPEVPENPETPEPPETPEIPETPEVPEPPEVPENPETPENPDIPPVDGSENPPTPEEKPETSEVYSYDARAVLHRPAESTADTLFLNLLQADGQAASGAFTADSVLFESGFFTISSYNPDTGRLSLTLTETGKAALANGENLYDYASITINGHQYTTQLVVNQTGDYSAQAVAEAGKNGGRLIHGEWHSGEGLNGGHTVESSGKGDTLVFAGNMLAQGETNSIRTNTQAGANASVTINATAESSAAMHAVNGSNLIDGGGAGTSGVSLNARSEWGTADGMLAQQGGQNIIQNVQGNVNVAASMGDALNAGGHSAENRISAVGDVHLHGGSTVLNASQGGHNRVSASGADSRITAQVDKGMAALQAVGGDNTLNANSIDVLANTHKDGSGSGTGMVYGLNADLAYTVDDAGNSVTQAGHNTLHAGDSVDIKASSSEEAATGLFAQGAEQVESRSEDYSQSSSIPVDYAANTITAGGAVTVQARGTSGASGIESLMGGKNTIGTLGNVDIQAQSDAGQAYAMRASGGTESRASSSSSNGGNNISTMSQASEGSSNSITADGAVQLRAEGQTANAMSAEGGAGNTINSGAGVDIAASASAGDAFGMAARGAGNQMEVTTSFIDGQGSAAYHFSAPGSTNTATARGAASVKVEAAANAYALNAEAGGVNLVAAASAGILAHSEVGNAFAIRAQGAASSGDSLSKSNMETNENSYQGLHMPVGSSNTVQADGLASVQATSHTGGAFAMLAQDAGNNTVQAQNAEVLASGLNAYALSAQGMAQGNRSLSDSTQAHSEWVNVPSANTILADSAVTVQAQANGGEAYALNAREGGHNTIKALGAQGIEVRISVAAGEGQKALALYAQGEGSQNRIEGGAGDDSIYIKGDILAEDGGVNRISLGGGTNRLVLDGAVNAGGLSLEKGDGFDILVLRAPDAASFNERFHDWLNTMTDAGILIDRVEVLLGSGENLLPDALDWMHSLFGAEQLVLVPYAHALEAPAPFAMHTDDAASVDYDDTSGSFTIPPASALATVADLPEPGAHSHSTSGGEWFASGIAEHAALFDSSYGTQDTLVVPLSTTSDLDHLDAFSGMDGLEKLWLDLSNTGHTTIDDTFLDLASKTLDNGQVFILRDADDQLDLSAWSKSPEPILTVHDAGLAPVQFETYVNEDGLKLYIELLSNTVA